MAINNAAIAILSNACLIHSGLFAKMSPVEQTALLATTNGKPVVFYPTFAVLTDKKALVNKLLAGTDVSVELEYNKITLSPTELAAFEAVRPILERIQGLPAANYPWLPIPPEPEYLLNYHETTVTRRHYTIRVTMAEKIWADASAYWATMDDTTMSRRIGKINVSGYRQVELVINHNSVLIGCQTIKRADVEMIARHYGWAPNI